MTHAPSFSYSRAFITASLSPHISADAAAKRTWSSWFLRLVSCSKFSLEMSITWGPDPLLEAMVVCDGAYCTNPETSLERSHFSANGQFLKGMDEWIVEFTGRRRLYTWIDVLEYWQETFKKRRNSRSWTEIKGAGDEPQAEPLFSEWTNGWTKKAG